MINKRFLLVLSASAAAAQIADAFSLRNLRPTCQRTVRRTLLESSPIVDKEKEHAAIAERYTLAARSMAATSSDPVTNEKTDADDTIPEPTKAMVETNAGDASTTKLIMDMPPAPVETANLKLIATEGIEDAATSKEEDANKVQVTNDDDSDSSPIMDIPPFPVEVSRAESVVILEKEEDIPKSESVVKLDVEDGEPKTGVTSNAADESVVTQETEVDVSEPEPAVKLNVDGANTKPAVADSVVEMAESKPILVDRAADKKAAPKKRRTSPWPIPVVVGKYAEEKKSTRMKEGLFSPVVLAAGAVMGQDDLKVLRAKVIGYHSDIVKSFVGTSDSSFGEAVLKQLFQLVDTDNSGYLDKEELAVALDLLGFKWLGQKDVDKIFKKADYNKDGQISMEEFVEETPKVLKVQLIKLAKKNGADMGLMVTW